MSETVERPTPRITVETATESDLKQALMGTPGNPSYEEQYGITSAPLGSLPFKQPSLAELELDAEKAMARAINPNDPGVPQAVAGDIAALQEELTRFKKLYGDGENEKGELRRQYSELTEAFNGLMAQFESQQHAPQMQQQVGPPQFAPNYQPPPPNFDPLADIGEEDYVEGKKVKRLVRETIGPAMAALAYQAQQAAARAEALERQFAAQARVASGITPLDEYRLAGKNPWLRNLPEAQRLEAMRSLKMQEAVVSQAAAQKPETREAQQRILSKTTYVEGGKPNVPDNSAGALEAAYNRDLAQVMTLPLETGARARGFRDLATKYRLELGQHPSDLSR